MLPYPWCHLGCRQFDPAGRFVLSPLKAVPRNVRPPASPTAAPAGAQVQAAARGCSSGPAPCAAPTCPHSLAGWRLGLTFPGHSLCCKHC